MTPTETDPDVFKLQCYALEQARALDQDMREKANEVLISESEAAIYFWDNMTTEDKRVMSQYLVTIGKASWVYPR